MQEFKLKVLQQPRAYLGFTVTIIALMTWLGRSEESYASELRILGSIVITFVSAYIFLYLFSFGILTIKVHDGKIQFDWQKKPLLDFNNYQDIEIREITKIKVDTAPQGNSIKLTIYSEGNKVTLANFENFHFLKDDLFDFVQFLELAHLKNFREKPIMVTNSWAEFKKKWYSKIIAYIFIALFLASIGFFLLASVENGFKLRNLAKLLIVISLFLSFWKLYKSKNET